MGRSRSGGPHPTREPRAMRGRTSSQGRQPTGRGRPPPPPPTTGSRSRPVWPTSHAGQRKGGQRPPPSWIRENVRASQRYRPPRGRGLRRKDLHRVRKSTAGRYYQLLSGRAAIGSYLCDKIHRIQSSECWWCESGERQTVHHLVAECRA